MKADCKQMLHEARKRLLSRINALMIGEAMKIPSPLGGGYIVRGDNDFYCVLRGDEVLKFYGGKRKSTVLGTGRTRIARDKVVAYLCGEDEIAWES
jgi:hypothetical protein